MSISRNVYHTSIKLSYRMNLLDDEIIKMIPKSTLHRFRNSDYSNIFGIELSQYLQQNELLIKELAQCRTALSVSRCIIKIKNTVISIRESALSGFNMMKVIVDAVNSAKDITGLDRALSQFSISRSTFHSWSFQVKHYCFDSFAGKCLRRWPNQLLISSVEKIKSLCEDERFSGWPLVSIAHFAKRNNLLNISLNTWYKYSKMLGISKKPPKCLKKRKTGIRADKPHQFWHADTTEFRTMDNIKAYIYFVVDNYSRAILSWHLSLNESAFIMLDSVKEAYNKFIIETDTDVRLIVDGGSENNNSAVDSFINSDGKSIKKIIAQQDIIFSNSIVEAVNKIVKYRSLYLENIPDINALRKHLEKFVPVYNEVRPHCSLKGLTPAEVLAGLRPDNVDHLKSVNLMSTKRFIHDKNSITCTECS